MKLKLIAVGEQVPNWIAAGYAEYVKRLNGEVGLEIVAVKAEKRHKNSNVDCLRDKEAVRILALLHKRDTVIALDEHGCAWSTLELSVRLQQWRSSGANVCLLIGGADGLAAACKQRAAQLWSLSTLTLPHALVRLIVAEQLYRAWTVIIHHPYHRA